MSQPPIIGITTYGRNETNHFSLPASYGDAVQAAGGVPILLTPQTHPARMLQIVDGLIFAGGGDIDPIAYGGTDHPTIYSVDPERDRFELHLAELALKSAIPVLAICRGLQIFTVVTGGDLVPHVPEVFGTTVAHRLDHPRRPIEHPVEIVAESRLALILETTSVSVVSWHHQAVRTLPPNWQLLAQAADGLVEAMEYQHHPWLLALQWHPEMSGRDSVQQRIFQTLVQVASDRPSGLLEPRLEPLHRSRRAS